ncbi:hypothetical protein HYDPIDRAFT_105488 [Hydnomerulius pinastri MD-312]|nr:hypothetical protein HYDPIDRAFT_105488 [Hydnomerulius pinastri MD-312]
MKRTGYPAKPTTDRMGVAGRLRAAIHKLLSRIGGPWERRTKKKREQRDDGPRVALIYISRIPERARHPGISINVSEEGESPLLSGQCKDSLSGMRRLRFGVMLGSISRRSRLVLRHVVACKRFGVAVHDLSPALIHSCPNSVTEAGSGVFVLCFRPHMVGSRSLVS